jgi:anti-sigma B factor antagonist
MPAVQFCPSAELAPVTKNYIYFMIPKPMLERLSINMESAHTNQSLLQLHQRAAFGTQPKESTLKLSLETRNRGDVMIVHCQGRIVYRDEAASLSHVVGEVLHHGGKVVLDLGGVTSIDSAGIGELVFLHTRAQSQKADLKVSSPSPLVRELLDLTQVDSLLEIHPNLDDAMAAFQFTEVCADC